MIALYVNRNFMKKSLSLLLACVLVLANFMVFAQPEGTLELQELNASSLNLTAMGVEAEQSETHTKWRIVNNSGEDVAFTWAVYGTELTGSSVVAKEHTMDARFEDPFYLYVVAPHKATLIIKWGTESEFNATKASSLDVIYPELMASSLALTGVPIEANKVDQTKWRVVNNYGFPVTFNWEVYGTEQSGTITVPAVHTNEERFAQPFYFYAPISSPATMKIYWGANNVFSTTKQSNSQVTPYSNQTSLVLTSVETEELKADNETKWRVFNRLGHPVSFTYQVAGHPELTGTYTIGAEHTEAARFENPFYFYVNKPHAATVIILWGNENEFKTTKASGGKVLPDQEPTIKLNGSAAINLAYGAVYTELGAVAMDFEDGELEVITEGAVNVNRQGNYTITYAAQDTYGHIVTVTRVITVQAAPVVEEPEPTTQPTTDATQTPVTLAPVVVIPTTSVAEVVVEETTLVVVTTAVEEIVIEDEPIALGDLNDEILDETQIPLGDGALPQTGEGFMMVFYAIGGVLTLAGVYLKR